MKRKYNCPIIEVDLLEGEEFLPVTTAYDGKIKPGYLVSNKGRVFHPVCQLKKSGGIMKQSENKGYKHVSVMTKDNKSHYVRINKLELQTFQPRDDYTGLVVDHINGDPSDNNLENLRYSTLAENSKNAVRNGKLRKATDEQIEQVYSLAQQYSDKEINSITGLPDSVIKSIRKKNAFYYNEYLKDKDPIVRGQNGAPPSISRDDAVKIHKIMEDGYYDRSKYISGTEVGKMYDVDRKTIDYIKFCEGAYKYLDTELGLNPVPRLKK